MHKYSTADFDWKPCGNIKIPSTEELQPDGKSYKLISTQREEISRLHIKPIM